MLNKIEYGSGGIPLLVIHGLFGSARNWGIIAKRLAKDRHVITVDMRNHGHSPRMDDQSYHAMADDIAQVATQHGQVDVIGHSMGGKAAMVAALSGAPFRKLLVADIAPTAYGHTQQHLIDAMASLDLNTVETRKQAETELTTRVDDPQVRAFLLQSLDIKKKNWLLNLPVLSNFMDQIVGWPDTDGSFLAPTLFLSGANSDYVLPTHRGTIKRLFPKARFAKIPNAGHWLHAEQPRAFEETARIFFGDTS